MYVERSLGRWVGTVVGLATWFSLTSKTAFATVGLGTYLVLFVPDAPTKMVAIGVLSVLLLINVIGTGKATAMQILLVGSTIIALIGLAAASVSTADPALLQPPFPDGIEGIVAGAGLVFVSYAGVTKICSVAEEVKNPHRNLPLGMLAAQATVMVLYALVALALTSNIPMDVLGDHHNVTPIATLAETVWGDVGRTVFAVISVVGLLSMCNAGVMASSRFPFAMARDHVLPPQLESVSPSLRHSHSIHRGHGPHPRACWSRRSRVYQLAKLASAMKLFIFCASQPRGHRAPRNQALLVPALGSPVRCTPGCRLPGCSGASGWCLASDKSPSPR